MRFIFCFCSVNSLVNIIKNTIEKNSEDDDEEEDDIQITLTTNSFWKRATRYLLQIVRLVSVVEGGSSYFMCRLEAGHIMSICSGKNRPTGNYVKEN